MTHGLFLFQIRDVFFQLGKEHFDMKPQEIEAYVKAQLEIRAYDTYHSLMWREAKNIALAAFADGYNHNGYSHY